MNDPGWDEITKGDIGRWKRHTRCLLKRAEEHPKFFPALVVLGCYVLGGLILWLAK